ncbi:MAG: M20 aminoacylase family protein [Beijerinckiaceae bacterium]
MTALDRINAFAGELTAIRRDIHAHPEIGFEEVRTSGLVARELEKYGIEVHTGIGKTGVVGIVHGKRPGNRRVGLRADMDALPMDETADVPWKSKVAGKFHGCGHDGHTTMLLGAARYLAETRDFSGSVALIFQPAEEGLGGARAMIADGLFERFPCDEVYGIHNFPGSPFGQISMRKGPAMAGSDFFDIHITGKGAHGAMPEHSCDPIMIGAALAQSIQTIVSRNAPPLQGAVVSITKFNAGSAYNIIPETAHLAGTIRIFDDHVRKLVERRMRELAAGMAAAYGAKIDVEIRDIFSVLKNADEQTDAIAQTAAELFGAEKVVTDADPKMGSEDFADMSMRAPGAYVWIGMGPGAAVHNGAYQFNDEILPLGASLLARVAEKRLAG